MTAPQQEQQQPWRCLRGHVNEPEVRRCAVCRLPWWVKWHTLVGTAAIVLVGGVIGLVVGISLLKEREYKDAVRKFMRNDGRIDATERKELESLAKYLRAFPEPSRKWELEVTGQKVAGPSPPPETITEELRRIRDALEQGRFADARQAIASLERTRPEDAEVRRLKEAIEQSIRVRIEVKVLGETAGHHVLDAQAALMVLTGRETGFRLYVEPHEQVYFYLYGIDGAGRVQVLFPNPQVTGGLSNPLQPGRAYEIPATAPDTKWFPLKRGEGAVKELYSVASRWPAKELERWGAAPTGEEASRNILQGLQARKAAQVGGCDVRSLQFAGRERAQQ